MGIRGLTTFINNRSHLYLQDHELHDCNIVIDGNSIASNLYKWHCKSNDCFGGDYDKFAHVIQSFFSLLSQCCITPYVIFDGGYEKRKLVTVISRMKNKIRAAENLNSVTEGSESVFPLFLREVFVDIVVSLGIKVARCAYEGDTEIATIAKILECPVLSYDSDFYIFGSLYIPFSTVDLTARKGKHKNTKLTFTYLSCKIYRIETFLQAFGGLDHNNLPLLAVLLGNDYIKRSLFNPFFKNLKIQKCYGNQSDQQKRIKSVIVWLQNETLDSAIKNILNRFKTAKRKLILKKIQGAMRGYFNVNSELLEFLKIQPKIGDLDGKIDFAELEKDVEQCSEDNNEESSSSLEEDTSESDDKDASENDKEIFEETTNEIKEKYNFKASLSKIFFKNFQNCQYPSCFMDIITQNKYYCIPQVEDSNSEHSHSISLDILSVIHKILTNSEEKCLTVVCRSGKFHIRFCQISKCSMILPELEEIENLILQDRKILFLNILLIDNDFSQALDLLPIEWHLFLISIKYAVARSSFDTSLIYSLILCFIVLNYIDQRVGFYRSTKSFEKKFPSFLQSAKNENSPQAYFVGFQNLIYKDCINFMKIAIPYFQMDVKLKTNYRMFDKCLVYSMSQMQSVFLHIKYLNSLLNNPYPNFVMHKTFNGTFVYNMTVNFRKRTHLKDYLDLFLKDCPSILLGLRHVLDLIYNKINFAANISQPIKKRRKKKKKKEENYVAVLNQTEDEEVTSVLDPNNLYSILSVM